MTEIKRKNPKYLEFIRSLPCIICRNPATEPHHIRSRLFVPEAMRGGTGLKPSDYTCVPLCHKHHHDVHAGTLTLADPHFDIIKNMAMYIDFMIDTN